MHLYKYIDNPEKVLKEGFIRCTQVSALNDPYEAHISEEKLIKFLSSEFGVHKGFKQDLKKKRAKIGVIALSETYDNPLMWSIYANHHKGAVIGIRALSDNPFIENALYTEADLFDLFTINTPYKIRYRRKPRFHLDGLDHDLTHLHGNLVDGTLSEIFLSKSFDWSHEQEHRYLIDLEKVDRVIAPEHIFSQRTLKFLMCICPIKKRKKNYYFDLCEIQDVNDRRSAGTILAEYSNNSEVVYFMKLKSKSVSVLFLGARSKKRVIKTTPELTCNFFRIAKAKIIPSSFHLDFDTKY